MIPEGSSSAPMESGDTSTRRPLIPTNPSPVKAAREGAIDQSASASSSGARQLDEVASSSVCDRNDLSPAASAVDAQLIQPVRNVVEPTPAVTSGANPDVLRSPDRERSGMSPPNEGRRDQECAGVSLPPPLGLGSAPVTPQTQGATFQRSLVGVADSGRSEANGRPHFLPLLEVVLDPSAQDRVRDECMYRRRCSKLDDFPPSAKTDWLDRAFRCRGRVLVDRAAESPADRLEQAWVVGDVHGDLVGLVAVFDVIKHQPQYRPSDVVILLGDLIDDLAESEEVLSEISSRIKRGEHILTIVGNHDDALDYRDDRGFGASVDPSEYCQRLRAIADSGSGHPSLRFARSFISYVRNAPVALFLGDGTLLAHGGVPHTDLTDAVSNGGWTEDSLVWSDFIWARLHPRAKSRLAVGGTRSRELGADDFRRFSAAVSNDLGFTPLRMVRGHDHVEARYELYGGRWNESVLTINNMSWKLPREAGIDGPRNPCIVRWTRGESAQPLLVCIDPEWRRTMQPEPLA